MNQFKQFALGLALAGAAGFAHVPAALAAATETFPVTITITATCDIGAITSATGVAFSNVASSAINATATGVINVRCTDGTPYTVELNNGLYFSGTRRMKNGVANYVGYGLYRDNAHTLPWDTGANVHSDIGSGAEQPVTVFGLVPSANSPAGAYTDTVTATVVF